MKLKEKVQVGSRIVRKYHPPKTPYQRVLESPDIPEATKELLRIRYESLDPFELRERIDQKMKRVKELARTSFDEWSTTQVTQ